MSTPPHIFLLCFAIHYHRYAKHVGGVDPTESALKCAKEAHDKRAFTDLKRGSMVCLVCQVSVDTPPLSLPFEEMRQ
jgi:hypothetical protein